MFGWRKDAVKISDRFPVFHVRYIGSTETFVASGKGCSYAPVQRLWDNSPGERHLRRVTVLLSQSGISLRDTDKNDEVLREFRIENISFCNTDTRVNDRIFSWICRDAASSRLDCHAVLCSTKQKAQTMAIVLSRAFQMAYKDWKSNKRTREMNRKPPAATRNPTGSGKAEIAAENKVLSPGTQPDGAMTSSVNSDTDTWTSESGVDRSLTPPADDELPLSSGFENSCILDPEVEAAIADVTDVSAAFDEGSDTE